MPASRDAGAAAAALPPTAPAGGYDYAAWRHFWSFQPVGDPPAPKVQNGVWVRNPIDAFVLANLEQKGLSPAAPADRATLIRRLSFDLTGLPPTVPEIRAFENDSSPDAWEHLVDRMLASPHYGEKWGRHWLDVARYSPGRISFPGTPHTAGDSHYRDYVVRAFNQDKPFDHFIIEQLAGDLLPPSPDRGREFDQITAPAFLSIGPWFDMCTDPNRLRLDMVDDMISATGKAFLGLSLGCARCHDHKFDPIPTADYYALAGIFSSTRIVGDFSEYWRDGRVRLLRPLAMPDEVAANQAIERAITDAKSRRWAFLEARRAELLKAWQVAEPLYRQTKAAIDPPTHINFEAEDFDGVYNLRVAELSADGKVVQVIETLNPTQQWARYKFEIKAPGDYRLDALYCSDEKCPVTIQINGKTLEDEALGEATGGAGLQYRRWQQMAVLSLNGGTNFLRVTRKEGNFPRIDKFRLVRVDDGFEQRVSNVAAERKLDPRLLQNFILDGQHPWPTTSEIGPYLAPADRTQIEQMDGAIAADEKRLRPYPMIVAVADQAHPSDMPIHVRGAVESVVSPAIPRGVPRLLDGVLPRPTIAPTNSGRLELARWIADPRNPLTARVIANRVWQWHFGRGLVETPSDFGSRGAAPSNPALLDWLARTLVEAQPTTAPGQAAGGAWSIKKLHRLILLSNTYQMSGDADARTLAADPDDRDLSRFAPRRLDAEELFDAMFSSTNILARQESGSALDLNKSLGRAMYVLTSNRAPPAMGPQVRKMFTLFDLDLDGVSIDKRPMSSTAAQSLFWMNNPLPAYYAGKFADRLLKMDKLDDAKRLDQAYLIAIGRPPEAEARAAALAYLDQLQSQGMSRQEAWTRIAQAIYASAAFHYVN